MPREELKGRQSLLDMLKAREASQRPWHKAAAQPVMAISKVWSPLSFTGAPSAERARLLLLHS